MNKQTEANTTDTATLSVAEARKCLATALEHGREVCGKVREKVVEGAKATDATVHKYPYQAIGIAAGVGALIGYVVALRRFRNHD